MVNALDYETWAREFEPNLMKTLLHTFGSSEITTWSSFEVFIQWNETTAERSLLIFSNKNAQNCAKDARKAPNEPQKSWKELKLWRKEEEKEEEKETIFDTSGNALVDTGG